MHSTLALQWRNLQIYVARPQLNRLTSFEIQGARTAMESRVAYSAGVGGHPRKYIPRSHLLLEYPNSPALRAAGRPGQFRGLICVSGGVVLGLFDLAWLFLSPVGTI